MADSTYLITGGAGFIGSHLTDALLERGARVVVLDDLSTGYSANLAAASTRPGFRFVRGSVLDGPLVDELVRQSGTVVHLAAAVGVRLVVEHPLDSFTTNVKGTETVLEAAHRHGKRLVVASTSEIYGKNASGPLAEGSDRVLGSISVARWWYSTAKAVDEILATAYHREHGLDSTVVRFFNCVGPRQSPAYGMVVPRLAAQAVRGEALTVHGTGTQRRCFTHVDDTVDALLRLLDHPGATGGTYNVGSSEEISILALAERIRTTAGTGAPIRLVPHRDVYGPDFEDMERRVPDTTTLRDLTGWRPLRNLDTVIADALTDARAALAGETLPSPQGERQPGAVAAGSCPA
ncbi:NAD-dependent epimerase/dehydratase family protein [Kitasatospora arboriphila]|uniref:GDP-mannose 4,6-dehydratase n=1 Tax=Kitasatospora arboriphila TaxID=258052 RepID=A0ABN1TWM3_9ACTN